MRHSYLTGSLFTNSRPTHKRKEKWWWKFPKNVGWRGICIQQILTIKAPFPSISNCYWLRASKSTQKLHQRSSAIYFIKISPWRSTDSQIWPWKEKHIYSNPHKGKMERKHLGTRRMEEKMSSAERVPKGKAWAILALRSLNGHLLIFFTCPVKTRQINQLKKEAQW